MVVITGSIATGKSSVCRLLRDCGYVIVDADKIAKEIIDAKVIKRLFGASFVKNGEIDRKSLGDLVFNNPKERAKLNNYIHPLIKEKIDFEVKNLEAKHARYIVDIPLYFESGKYDAKLATVVYCSKDEQIKRLMSRENLSYKEALMRVKSQMDIEEKKIKADYVIDNSKNRSHLLEQSKKFMEYLSANFKI